MIKLKHSYLFRFLSACLVILLAISSLSSSAFAAEPRTTVYLSDDTMDYVTGTRTYYFTVPGEYIPNESPYLTTTYQISYFYEDRYHSHIGTLNFENLTDSDFGDVPVDFYEMVAPGHTVVNLIQGCRYKVTFSPDCSDSYMMNFNLYLR